MYENIVVEKDSYQVTDDERYVGAHVFPPFGTYKNGIHLILLLYIQLLLLLII